MAVAFRYKQVDDVKLSSAAMFYLIMFEPDFKGFVRRSPPASALRGKGVPMKKRASKIEALEFILIFVAASQEWADALIVDNAAAGALGMFQLTYRFILLALQAAAIAGFAILMAACIKAFA
jgi:hypothetical protein